MIFGGVGLLISRGVGFLISGGLSGYIKMPQKYNSTVCSSGKQ